MANATTSRIDQDLDAQSPAADLVRDDRLKQSYFGFGDH